MFFCGRWCRFPIVIRFRLPKHIHFHTTTTPLRPTAKTKTHTHTPSKTCHPIHHHHHHNNASTLRLVPSRSSVRPWPILSLCFCGCCTSSSASPVIVRCHQTRRRLARQQRRTDTRPPLSRRLVGQRRRRHRHLHFGRRSRCNSARRQHNARHRDYRHSGGQCGTSWHRDRRQQSAIEPVFVDAAVVVVVGDARCVVCPSEPSRRRKVSVCVCSSEMCVR